MACRRLARLKRGSALCWETIPEKWLPDARSKRIEQLLAAWVWHNARADGEGKMKAGVLHEFGRAPQYGEFAEPAADKDEAVVRVRAASLKAIDKQLANGSHYASPRELPAVCGTDGVGDLENGTRVFFGGPKRPYGAMAERTVVPSAFCFPVPSGIDDDTAAALPNPGVSAWL